ncbi:MAG: trypsin-like peptidase domain-containing protein [Actinomycetota bacterium]
MIAAGLAVSIGLAACTSTGSLVGDSATVVSKGPRGLEAVADVADLVLPAVVNVTTDVFRPDSFGGVQEGQGVGTGFIVRSDGFVVTNCHVVEDASRITVFTSDAEPDQYEARVVGGDCLHDLAVLKIDATGLPTVPLGDSGSLRLGQQVVAVGYALALEGGPSVTSGIVSSLDRVIQARDAACDACPNGLRTYSDVIQTDAAINHGNSGGPLVDMAGRVVGINTAGSDAAENIGFAIAIDAARETIASAMTDPLGASAYLGVQTQDVSVESAFQLGLTVETGAYVVATAGDGPAQGAGIDQGDVIVGIDGEAVASAADVGRILEGLDVGADVQIEVVRPDGEHDTVDVILGTRPLPTVLP